MSIINLCNVTIYISIGNYVFQTLTLHKFKCNTVHCQWGPWEVTECDKTCGGGTKTSTREITQEAQNEGNACTGESTITESCNVQECPSKSSIFNLSLLLYII